MHGGEREPVRAILEIALELDFRTQDRGSPATHHGLAVNQPAYHSMINRRSVPALHRACLHQRNQPDTKNSGRYLTFLPIENGHDSDLVDHCEKPREEGAVHICGMQWWAIGQLCDIPFNTL
jgi:hypothetical protein